MLGLRMRRYKDWLEKKLAEPDDPDYAYWAWVAEQAARRGAEFGLVAPEPRHYLTPLQCKQVLGGLLQQIPHPLLTINEASLLLGIAPRTLRDVVNRGQFPSVRVGGSIRIRQRDCLII